MYSRIFVDGRVFFCCEHIEVGDVHQAPFDKLWLDEPYSAVRRRLQAGQVYPGCARCGKHDMNFSAAQQLQQLQRLQTEQSKAA